MARAEEPLADIVARIDAALAEPTGGCMLDGCTAAAVHSVDFCTEAHQARWQARGFESPDVKRGAQTLTVAANFANWGPAVQAASAALRDMGDAARAATLTSARLIINGVDMGNCVFELERAPGEPQRFIASYYTVSTEGGFLLTGGPLGDDDDDDVS